MPPTDLPPYVLQTRRRVGDRIRTIRLERGLTQEKLGELADLDRKTINRVEVARFPTSLDHLVKIAHALGVPLTKIFNDL